MTSPAQINYDLNQRTGASHHLQVRINESLVGKTPRESEVRATVVRVFRGSPALLDRPISFSVRTHQPDDNFPPGADGGFPAAKVAAGSYFEAYLQDDAAGFNVLPGGVALIDQPTDASQFETWEKQFPQTPKDAPAILARTNIKAAAIVIAIAAVVFLAWR